MAERWLILSYWANCEARAPSHHLDDRLAHFRTAGIEAEVITSVCGPRPVGWRGRWHRVPSLLPSGYCFEVRQLTRGLSRPLQLVCRALLMLPVLPLYVLEKVVANPESTFWWWVSAGPAGLWWSCRSRPDLIYSTGGAVSAHLAAAVIARRSRVPWIAELQDPLPYQRRGRGVAAKWLVNRLEKLIHTRATGVVYLTQAAAARAAARAAGSAACCTIYAGAEPHPLRRNPPRGDRMRLVHAGTLSGSRTPETLLRALAELAAGNHEARRDIRLMLLGATDAAVRRMAEAFPYPEMVEVVSRQPRPQARETMERADLLLVIQNLDRVSEETVPSKTYEYLASGRPVLGLVYRNPELSAMLCEAGHQAVEVDDVAAIEAALENVYHQWRKAGLSAMPCDRYTSARAVVQLISWSRDLRAPERIATRV